MTVIDKPAIPPTLSAVVGLEGGTEDWVADNTAGVAADSAVVVVGEGVISGVTVGVTLGVGDGVGVAAETISPADLPDGVS